jgi:hypothetical protein
MIETLPPLVPELQMSVATAELARLLEQVATLRLENAALRAENVLVHERIRELEARLGPNFSNASRRPCVLERRWC